LTEHVGADAGQTVPHTHFHIVPREKIEREGEMIDKERGQIALGEGPRAKLDAEEGKIVSELVKVEVKKEIQKLKGAGELVGGEGGELWMKVEGRGLKL
jgi:diadenosine tetraphosphate (Ap4A) HIT family hydrolase